MPSPEIVHANPIRPDLHVCLIDLENLKKIVADSKHKKTDAKFEKKKSKKIILCQRIEYHFDSFDRQRPAVVGMHRAGIVKD